MTRDREDTLSQFPAVLGWQRDALFARIRENLEADHRVVAAWLAGSFGRGTEDAWSDLDLHVVIRDDALAPWLRERERWFARLGRPLMVMPSPASERGDWQGVVFAGPVWLDLAVHPVSTATREADTRLLFALADIPLRTVAPLDDEERRSRLQHDLDFFWAMTPIALKYIGRGRTDRAVRMVELLMEAFVRLWRYVRDPERIDAAGASWLHLERDSALITAMPRFGATIDPPGALTVVSRLMDGVRDLHPEIERHGIEIPDPVVREIERFRDEVANMVFQRASE